MTPKNFKIRKAIPADAPILAAAEREIAKIPGRLASRPEELKDENFKGKILSLTSKDTGTYVVLEFDGTIVGHACLEPRDPSALSHVVALTIAVHERHQGNGYGKILMNHLVEWAKANRKVEKFELQVRSSNVRAIKLYESMGFIEEGRKTKRLKIAEGQYLDDIYMALWVGPK